MHAPPAVIARYRGEIVETRALEGAMREITMYCSGCDRNVKAVLTDESREEGQAEVFDSEIICLEIGQQCTGGVCPVSAVSAEAMDARLAKSGLLPEIRRRLVGRCDGCDRNTEQVLSLGGYLSCTECGTTQRATLFH
jgi:hypothetical protein